MSIDETLIPELEEIAAHQADYGVKEKAAILDRLQKIDQASHPSMLTRFFRKMVYGKTRPTDEVIMKVSSTIAALHDSSLNPSCKISRDRVVVNRTGETLELTQKANPPLQTSQNPTSTNKAVVNAPTFFERLIYRWQVGPWALQDAAYRGDVAKIKEEIEKGIDPSSGGALRNAIDYGHIEAAKVLIAAGANVNAEVNHETPLVAACQQGRKDMVELLLNNGATAKGDIGSNALHELTKAPSDNQLTLVNLLLKAGASPFGRARSYHYYGRSPLVEACYARNLPLVKALLATNINLKEHDRLSRDYRDGHLAAAAASGDVKIVEYLLEKGAAIDKGRGVSALARAAVAGNVEMVDLLVKKGVPVNGDAIVHVIEAFDRNCNWFESKFSDFGYRGGLLDLNKIKNKQLEINRLAHMVQKLLSMGAGSKNAFGVKEAARAPLNLAMSRHAFAAIPVLLPLTPQSLWNCDRMVKVFPFLAKKDPQLANLFLRLGLSVPNEKIVGFETWGAASTSQNLSDEPPVIVTCKDGVSVPVHPDLLRNEFGVLATAFEMGKENLDIQDFDSTTLNKILQDITGVQKLSAEDLRNPVIALFLHQYDSKSFEILGRDQLGQRVPQILIAPRSREA